MAKVSCDIFQDMLSLYCDDVCSADSRKMIEEYLPECEVCSNMLHQLLHARMDERRKRRKIFVLITVIAIVFVCGTCLIVFKQQSIYAWQQRGKH